MKHSSAGFTLLEVLIALAIVALALVALVRTAGIGADAVAHQRDVTLANWVAANVLADLRVRERVPAIGRRDGTQAMGRREWRWEAVVQSTDEPSIRRIDVRVFAGTDEESSVVTLVGFAAQR